MRDYKEVPVNYIEMSVTEYAKQYGLSPSTVRRRCEEGLIDSYKISDDTKCSHWRIRFPKGNVVSRDDYERVLKENAELKARLTAAQKVLAG